MRQQHVMPGDTLYTVAARAKAPAERIWELPQNAALRKERGYPDALVCGDVLVTPEPETKEADGRTGAVHEVQVERATQRYRVQLLVDGEPCAGAQVQLDAPGAQAVKTDGEGRFELDIGPAQGEGVPQARRTWNLRVRFPAVTGRDPPLRERERVLRIVTGALATKVEFLMALLTNLGFHCDLERDGEPYGVSPRTLSAFHRFRRVFGLIAEHEVPDETVPPFVKPPLVAEADLRKKYAPAFEKLLRLHSQVATPTKRFLAKEKLGRLRSPLHRLFLGPLWNRINVLEGPEVIVDAHMHVMSGKCSPLPLVWDKNGALRFLKPGRTTMSVLSGGATGYGYVMGAATLPLKLVGLGDLHAGAARKLGRFGRLGDKSTADIAAESVKSNAECYGSAERSSDEFLSTMVALPMDMDMGHLDGVEGKLLYNAIDTWYERTENYEAVRAGTYSITKVLLPEENTLPPGPLPEAERQALSHPMVSCTGGEVKKVTGHRYYSYSRTEYEGRIHKVWTFMPDAEWETYQPYLTQIKHTLAAERAAPWSLLPLYHYDPRRWKLGPGDPVGVDTRVGDKEFRAFPRRWDEPLQEYFKDGGPRPFIGIKQYTALGYKPLDARLPCQENLYQYLQEKKVPLLCHCTPGGFYALERPLFALDELGRGPEGPARVAAERKVLVERLARRMADNGYEVSRSELEKDAGDLWFSEQYVSPYAWLAVLKKFPKLRLCLAHFGGDEGPFTNWQASEPNSKHLHDLKTVPWGPDMPLLWDDQLVKLALEYEHFYIDLSYFELKPGRPERLALLLREYPELRDKLLFGTDWWMIEKDGIRYAEFVRKNRNVLDVLDWTLWQQLTQVNPARFYRLKENADAIARGLRSRDAEAADKQGAGGSAIDFGNGLEVLKSLDPEKLNAP